MCYGVCICVMVGIYVLWCVFMCYGMCICVIVCVFV